VNRERVKKAAEEAAEVFWAKIVELYPESTSGDLSPEDCRAFDEACRRAVTLWVYWNVGAKEVDAR
jgi:hypothetical protein